MPLIINIIIMTSTRKRKRSQVQSRHEETTKETTKETSIVKKHEGKDPPLSVPSRR